jgi:hypothetical protein
MKKPTIYARLMKIILALLFNLAIGGLPREKAALPKK